MNASITVELPMDLSWSYASGEAMERFCNGLRERRIEAMQCEGCGRRNLPPRPFCGICRLRLSHWVQVKDEGVLEAWTVVHLPILDARTGGLRPTPYGMGLIRLDGADTTLNHYLAQAEPSKLAIGQRVRAVWRDELEGSIGDILHFEVVG